MGRRPISKKIGIYQTPLIGKHLINRDFPKLEEINVRSLRYEIARGKDNLYGQPTFTIDRKNVTEDWSSLDNLVKMTIPYCDNIIFSNSYSPKFLNQGDWRNPPNERVAKY